MAFANAIIDEEPTSKDKPAKSLESLSIPPASKKNKKTLASNELFLVKKTRLRVELSAKVDDDDDITDTDDDIDNLPSSKKDEGQMDLTDVDDDNEKEDEEDDSDDCSDDSESYSGIEPVDITLKDDMPFDDQYDDEMMV